MLSMEESDAAAVSRARSGDSQAFRLLVEHHSRNIFRLAYRMTGNEQDAEDVVQETFFKAFRQLTASRSARTSAPGCTASGSIARWICCANAGGTMSSRNLWNPITAGVCSKRTPTNPR